MSPIVTRFAPSPTGHLHIGGARTALFCFLFSRHHKGKFLLRLEDTDRERSKEEFASSILEALRWLGLDWDGDIIKQSQRTHIYTQVAHQLLESENAYRCECSPERLARLRADQQKSGEKPKYDGLCRDKNIPSTAPGWTLRFRNPQAGVTVLTDLVKGEVRVNNAELDDMILLRSDGSPTYNLCVVVDDIQSGITHILRGDDHLINSARQLGLYAALQQTSPHFAHLPMILNQEGKRLSKRESADNILLYRDKMHILPEALCSYLARLGWSHGDQEIFEREELIRLFSIEEINRSAAAYDANKLLWINAHFIRKLARPRLDKLLSKMLPQNGSSLFARADADSLLAYHLERAEDLSTLAAEIAIYCQTPKRYAGRSKFIGSETPRYLHILSEKLLELQDWQPQNIQDLLKLLIEKLGIKFAELGMPMRLALTGEEKSAPLQDIAFFLGREETYARLNKLRDHLLAPPQADN